MLSDVRLLTYDELSTAYGITRESARQLVLRKRWMRRKGNDGRARIEVPLDALPPVRTPTDPSDPTSDRPGADTSSTATPAATASDEASVVTVLTRHIARLEKEIADMRDALMAAAGERDAERARAMQVDVLRAILEAEQRRAGELRDERDRWHGAATLQRGLMGWLRRSA